jgi:hypothetical protein
MHIFLRNFKVVGWKESHNLPLNKLKYFYNYHNPGHYPSSCVLFKTRNFGNWILSPSSAETYSVGPNRSVSGAVPIGPN